MIYAEVVVDVPLSRDEEHFDYLIPERFRARAVVGSRVLVPFQKRKLEGYIIRLKNESKIEHLKEIYDVLDEQPPLSEELVQLGQYISKRYLCPLFLTLQAMVPASLRSKYVKWIQWNEEMGDMPLIVLPEEEEVLLAIRKAGEVELKAFLRKYPQAEKVIERFVQKGFLKEITRVKDEGGAKKEEVVQLLSDSKEIKNLLPSLSKAPKQAAILEYLIDVQTATVKECLAHTGAKRSALLALVERGLLKIYLREVRRDPFGNREFQREERKKLTPEQSRVFQELKNAIHSGKSERYLLHGVTGSGKTEIYLQIIEDVLQLGRDAIVLVPEISLTPMMVDRFKRRFGDLVAVLHSNLSPGERMDEWRRIRKGAARVVVGARSAIFAPVQRLGVVIIDEEHESTYKQEEQPRYQAKEVAFQRAQYHGSIVILGSATPSMETYAYAKAGRIKLLEMTNRVNEQKLPEVHLIDMREELRQGHRHMFSRKLISLIEDRLQKKEQMVLLLNRRGYSTFVICRSCGYIVKCPHCDITLTYHLTNQTIRCHYCGYTESMVKKCPKCDSAHIRYFGSGTQKVEEELGRLFPGIRVIRMDMDTTAQKGAHEKLLTSFANEEADVLLGTQMIAKGLDFPKVSLVGMITADTMLHLPDFRSAERTFQLITQVAGRAGRHQIPGEVIVQTYTPEHYSIQLAVKQDYISFFNQEIKMRKLGKYPPFYRLCIIHFTHTEVPVLVKSLGKFAEELRLLLSSDSVLMGPVPSTITKIKDRYRYHCMVKYRDEPKLNQYIKRALRHVEDMVQKNNIQVSIDIDPQVLI
jgi:primosomal protein N' (replication factor Y)